MGQNSGNTGGRGGQAGGGVGGSTGSGGSAKGGSSGNGGGNGGRSGGLLSGSVSGVGLGGAGYSAADLARAMSFTTDAGVVGTVTQNGMVYGTDRNGNIVANVSSAVGSARAAALQAATSGSALSGNSGGTGNAGGNSGGSREGLQAEIANLQASLGGVPAFARSVIQSQIAAKQQQLNSMPAPSAASPSPSGNDQAAQQAAQQAAAQQAEVERQRQQRIQTETQTRQSLQEQLGKTTSAAETSALLDKIRAVGSEGDNAAALNKALLDSATKRSGEQTAQEKNSQIGAAQAGITTASPASLNYAAGPNTSSVSSAVGTVISQTDQQKNAAEARRMGGYNDQDQSTMSRIGRVARSTLSGLSAGGIPGALVGGAASVYNNFISDRQSASSRALTQSKAAPTPGVGDALAGMGEGALKGAPLGPLGMAIGAIWGGMQASGTAPTAADLKGQNPLNGGVTADPNSYGPGQTLANGVRVGNGNNGGNGTRTPGGTGANLGAGGGTAAPSTGNSNAGVPSAPSGNPTTGSDQPGGAAQAGQSAFSKFMDDLRRRQMDNLLYTGAGWDKTSGTSLLGRVGAAQGAAGGLTGNVISQWGGGKSLLGGAWSF